MIFALLAFVVVGLLVLYAISAYGASRSLLNDARVVVDRYAIHRLWVGNAMMPSQNGVFTIYWIVDRETGEEELLWDTLTTHSLADREAIIQFIEKRFAAGHHRSESIK